MVAINNDMEFAGQEAGSRAIAALRSAGTISSADLTALRRDIFADGAPTRAEADALFDLENDPSRKCAEWTSFFVEHLTDHVVWQARPTGTLSDEQAEWLLERATRAASLNALALLVNVLAEAHRVPTWFLGAVRGLAAQDWPGVDLVRAGMLPASEAA